MSPLLRALHSAHAIDRGHHAPDSPSPAGSTPPTTTLASQPPRAYTQRAGPRRRIIRRVRCYAFAELDVTDPAWVKDYITNVTPLIERLIAGEDFSGVARIE